LELLSTYETGDELRRARSGGRNKLDEYSKSGPKSPKATAGARERQVQTQMRDLLAINDESTLVSVLKSDYSLTPRDPRYKAIMQIWRDAQQRLQHER
jgi:hypothetical protein